ncbi:DoxX family protein [Aurantiacibacter poecillastricola]|uniref:DoxX family protein n=1 Tax=Aurantiacibacter poecillastricola TaxID=3064385 RepID=UPI00273F6F38|nr:DoxX family protein [Aurantiacibacter sp. 219JJ12-13]MDP5263491.1 DoxX family protein [Aurantiacibacter sp. 219JJ12-13]
MIRTVLTCLLALFYAYAGYRHIVGPEPFLQITPVWVPYPEAVIHWTGFAEIAGALALAQPFSKRLRQAGGIGLALYALCVWPANINHMLMDMASDDGGFGMAYHVPRMIAQPIIIWLALWCGRVTDWPFNRRG